MPCYHTSRGFGKKKETFVQERVDNQCVSSYNKNIMKLRFLPLLFMCTAAVTPAVAAVPVMRADEPAIQAASNLLRRQIALLEGVHDRASADAAAPVYSKLEQTLESDDTHRKSVQALISDDSDEYGKLQQRLWSVAKELEKRFFYGSVKLASAMEQAEEKALLPVPMTPAILAEMEARARRSFALLPPFQRKGVSGGPGFSRETAWRFTTEEPVTDINDATPFEPYLLMGYGDSWPTCLNTRYERTEESFYRITTAVLIHRGQSHVVDIWEDLSGCVTRVSAEQEAQALVEHKAMVENWLHTLRQVNDSNSAAAAAQQMEAQMPRYRELLRIFAGMLPADTVAARKLHHLLEAYIDDELSEMNYYGDATLPNVLEDVSRNWDTPRATTQDYQWAHRAYLQVKAQLLEGVHNKESADVAADYWQDLINELHEFPYCEADDLEAALNEKIEKEKARLKAAHYYGSTLLAACFGSVTYAYVPQELTPEAAAEVERILRASLGKLPGGPGFSRETAWRTPAGFCTPRNQEDGSDFSLTPYEELITELQMADERLYSPLEDARTGFIDGKLYERQPMQALLQGKLYRFDIWFDLTEGHDVPTEEEYQAAYTAYIRQLQEKERRLRSVHDAASADAAAAWLSAQEKLWRPKYHPMTDNDDKPECVQTIADLRERIAELQRELGNKRCYGSSALTIQLCMPRAIDYALYERMSKAEVKAQEDAKIRETLVALRFRVTLDYVRLLGQLLPGITDQASAMAAARKLSAADAWFSSHILLLQREDIRKQVDTLPIRRHLKRITNAGFFGSVDLADILHERNSPSGPPRYQAPVDDVEPAE